MEDDARQAGADRYAVSQAYRWRAERDKAMQELRQLKREVEGRLMPEGMEWPRYESGEPVRIGDVVELETGCIPVEAIEFSRGKVCVKDAEDGDWSTSSYAMRPLKRPSPKVLAADGEPLLNGDEVWRVKDGSGPYHVQEIRHGSSVCVGETWLAFRPKELTHERPESWERIEEDAMMDAKVYCESRGISPEYPKHNGKAKCEDIVRRCRALAERERGE